ncbi:immunoglobulin E-set [Pisolithus tinctorius]|nr:immunoglobulin E-set [Pisolithus tinctorius]
MDDGDLHDVELVWPHTGPNDVIVTGTFDQWSSSIHLVKGDTGFHGTVKLPWGEKVAYKFIVDGYWFCRDDRPMEDDGSGHVNNILYVPQKPLSPLGENASAVEATLPSEPKGVAPIVPMVVVPVNDVASGGLPPPHEVHLAELRNSEQLNGPSTHSPEIPPAQLEAVTESLVGMPSSGVSGSTENQSSKPLDAVVTPVVPESVAEQRVAPTDSAPHLSDEQHTSLPTAVQQNSSSTTMESGVTAKEKRLSIFQRLKRAFHKDNAERRKS